MEATEKFQVLLDLLEMDAESAKAAIVHSATVTHLLTLILHLSIFIILIVVIKEVHKQFNILNGYKEMLKFISTKNDKMTEGMKDTSLTVTKKEVLLFIKYAVLVIAFFVIISSLFTHFLAVVQSIIGIIRCYVAPDTIIMEYIKDVLALS